MSPPNNDFSSSSRLPITIIAIGGLKESGANCFLIEYNGVSIVIDCGVHPSHNFDIHEIWDRFQALKSHKVVTVILTHGHLDHAGAAIIVANMLNVPICCPEVTKHLVKAIKESSPVEEFENMVLPEIAVFKDRDVLRFGDFELTAYELEHSTPQSFGFLIRVGGEIIAHFGDFKLAGYKANDFQKSLQTLREMTKEPIKLAITEIVNIRRPGVSQPEEPVVQNLLQEILSKPDVRHFVFLFATNFRRILALWKLLRENGVNVVFRGPAMHRTAHILSEIIGTDVEDVLRLPRHATKSRYPVYFCTGCQGEPGSFMEYLAGRMTSVPVEKGDCVYLSSALIPFEDKELFAFTRNRLRRYLQNLDAMGARIFVHTGQTRALDLDDRINELHIHVSGHEPYDGLRLIWTILVPQMLLPYHGPAANLPLAHEIVKDIEQETGRRIIILEPDNNEPVRI